MTAFQQVSLALTAIWFALIMLRFRRSTVALVAGLVVVGGYTIVSLIAGKVSLTELGMDASRSWLATYLEVCRYWAGCDARVQSACRQGGIALV